MLIDTKTLKEFVQQVPTCTQMAPLQVVLEAFKERLSKRRSSHVGLGLNHPQEIGKIATSSNHLQPVLDHSWMVLDEQQRPIGLITLPRLMPYLFAESNSNLQSALQRPLSELDPPVAEPLMILSASMTPEQFWLHLGDQRLSTVATHLWAIVDSTGKFLGLLDVLQLIRHLAISTCLASTSELKAAEKAAPVPTTTLTPSDYPWGTITLLLQLLQQLPFPLMLQTSSGQVLSQNLAWQQQVGELSDPTRVTQDAAALLEYNVPAEVSGGSESLPVIEKVNLSQFMPSEIAPNLTRRNLLPAIPEPQLNELSTSKENNPHLLQSGLCQIGPEPGSCICNCPMRDGQERVWQFLKMPLRLDLTRTGSDVTTGLQSPEAEQFRLATLGVSTSLSIALKTAYDSLPQEGLLWLVMAKDLTDQQSIAKELGAKNADLTQLNRLKDEFLACISHELKTPLSAVLGLSSVLKGHGLGDLTERQARYVQLIHQSGRQLMSVVNDILDLTRIETHQLDLMPESLEIRSVCELALKQAKRLYLLDMEEEQQAAAKLAKNFRLEIEPDLDFLVADGLRLRQMLSHLLSNALKFTDVDGKFGLKVSRWEGWIAFTVWDTGIGIPSSNQHLIFQKFQKLENPLSQRFQGTGLGLILTQRLARLHGGEITFTSQEGQGSQFTLLLPPYPLDSAIQSKCISSNNGTSTGGIVLIAEASPSSLEDLVAQLTGLKYSVVIARSGPEVLEKARRLQPRVIFLNPLLPFLPGWDVLTLLKHDPETSQIPIIVTAASVEKLQAFQNGASDFLSLPIRDQDLQQSLARLGTQLAEATNPSVIAARHASFAVDGSLAPKKIIPLRKTLSQSTPLSKLTVLRLGYSGIGLTLLDDANASPLQKPNLQSADCSSLESEPINFSNLLHLHDCRVLEADDLEQAELLARIWKPHVILYDCAISNPLCHLKQLSQHPNLAALPIVTLDPETTRIANQVPELNVFPYLTSDRLRSASGGWKSTTLLKVLQVAAGLS